MTATLFVSGANGQFARAVIGNLLAAGRAESLVVGTRDVNSAFSRELAAAGVRVRESDFRRPDVMRKALEGVDRALLVPTYDSNTVRLQQNLNALQAAREAGVRHVVYASFLNAESRLVEHSRLVHFPTEQAIRESGLGFTLLRHGLYAEVLVGDLQQTLATGALRRPGGTARCAYIARSDLGESAACVLMQEDAPSGTTYTETMERTWSGAEIAELMSEVFGRPVRFDPVPVEEWPRYMMDNWGLPEELARSTTGTTQAIQAGEFDLVTGDYARITGHPPMTMRQFLERIRDERAAG